jgi:hypothetical protein
VTITTKDIQLPRGEHAKEPPGWETFHSLNKLFFLFFLLWVVLNVISFFYRPPPWGQKVPKYMIASGKIRDRNQVLAVFPFSFVCEFLT